MKLWKKIKLWNMKAANLIRAALSWMLGAKMPRPMQVQAWPVLTGNRERMLVASPGWGKTMMILMIALREQMFEKDRRILIIAPFKDIVSAYHSKKLWVPDRDWVGAVYFLTVAASAFLSLWLVLPILLLGLPVWRRYATHMLEIENLCNDDSSQTVSRAKEFLLGDSDIKTMSCCGASASRAWRELESEYDADTLRRLVRNISVWFDECQFARGGDENRNRLGDLLHAIVRGHESARPGLASATPIRRTGVIVHDDDIPKFERGTWRCPFDRHFAENMLRTEHMVFDYCAYEGVGGWQDDLTEYVWDKGKRMVVYIPFPHPGSLTSGGKISDYNMAESAIRKVFPDADIVNLVDDSAGANAARLETMRKGIQNGVEPDFVIAVRMMMVGSDWPNLRSIYDLAPSESLATDAQKCGRLHRDGMDKPTISHRKAFIKFGRMDAEKMRVHCSNRLNALISVLLMNYIFQDEPFFGSEGSEGSGGSGGEQHRNPALDWPELIRFIRIVESRLCIGTEIDNCIRVAKEVMDEMDVPNDIRLGLEHIVAHIEGVLSKKTADAVRENGSDPIGMGELSAGMTLQFGTGKVGLELLKNWRNSVRKLLTKDRIVEWIEEYRSRTGQLPTTRSGEILGTDESWANINSALREGHRGLPGGSSLLKLLREIGLKSEGISRQPSNTRLDCDEILSCAEIAAVLADLKRPAKRRSPNTRMNLVLFRLNTHCGLRASEMSDLKIGDVKINAFSPCIKVCNTGIERSVPLWGDDLIDDLTAWYSERLRDGANESDLFLRAQSHIARGNPLSRHNIRSRFISMCKVLGGQRQQKLTTTHGRNSFIYHALASGHSREEVRIAAGLLSERMAFYD